VLQNALIKLLADHYTVDYNVELDFFCKNLYLSFIQVLVRIKNPNLRPKIVKKSRNPKYLKKHKISKSNVLNAYRNMLVLVH